MMIHKNRQALMAKRLIIIAAAAAIMMTSGSIASMAIVEEGTRQRRTNFHKTNWTSCYESMD
jgi:hypothetical protein